MRALQASPATTSQAEPSLGVQVRLLRFSRPLSFSTFSRPPPTLADLSAAKQTSFPPSVPSSSASSATCTESSLEDPPSSSWSPVCYFNSPPVSPMVDSCSLLPRIPIPTLPPPLTRLAFRPLRVLWKLPSDSPLDCSSRLLVSGIWMICERTDADLLLRRTVVNALGGGRRRGTNLSSF